MGFKLTSDRFPPLTIKSVKINKINTSVNEKPQTMTYIPVYCNH